MAKIVKGIVLLLLLAATVLQPALAQPAACPMPGTQRAITCAGCCADLPCCAVSVRTSGAPLAAVASATSHDASILPAVSFSVALGRQLSPRFPTPSRLDCGFAAHSPPPLAVSCIRLV